MNREVGKDGERCGGCLQHQALPHVMIHERVLDGMLPQHNEAADPIAKLASQYRPREPKKLRGQIFPVLNEGPVDDL